MSSLWISRDDVFAALDMCEVLKHYDINPGRGTSFRINCPFHDDHRPSCSINPQQKVFNCFSCGTQGNVLDFIADMEELDPVSEFRAVLEKAIEIIGHNPTQQRSDRGTRDRNKTGKAKRQSNQKANVNQEEPNGSVGTQRSKSNKKRSAQTKGKIAEQSKPKDEVSTEVTPNKVLEGASFPLQLETQCDYLVQRNILQDIIDEFGIGYEPRKRAMMAGRVCFPIHNVQGDLVAYAGRWTSEDLLNDKGEEVERYLLPKGFKKSLELYNLHRVLVNHPSSTELVLVEGYWSVLRLNALSIPVVGLMGSVISTQQIQLLIDHGFKQITVMLDGDDEGRAATKKVVLSLAQHFFVRDIVLPHDQKPDDVDEAFLQAFVHNEQSPSTSQLKQSKPNGSKTKLSLSTSCSIQARW